MLKGIQHARVTPYAVPFLSDDADLAVKLFGGACGFFLYHGSVFDELDFVALVEDIESAFKVICGICSYSVKSSRRIRKSAPTETRTE
jgi:hypothetical protein